MSSAVEERRKIEEEIKERKQKLAELDKQENKTKHNRPLFIVKLCTRWCLSFANSWNSWK